MLSRRKRVPVALATVACAIVAGTAWAGTDEGASPATSSSLMVDGTITAGPVGEVQANIRSSFALFRDRPASPVPSEVAAQVASPMRFGRNPGLARAIDTVTGTGWVVPGDGYLCIVVPDPIDGYAVGCEPTEAAVSQGLRISLWGNMPNGKAAETLLVADGQRAAVSPEAPSSGMLAADAASADEPVASEDGVTSLFTVAPGSLHPVS